MSVPGRSAVRLADLARAWIAIGTQSVGGATSTIYLMRSRMVERTGWVSRREFMETYALAMLSPGIHLVALAGLLGHRLAGWRGLGVSVGGMMIPAAVVTVALTVLAVGAGEHPLMRSALDGIGPVTAGMTAGLALVTARATVRRGRRGLADLAIVAIALAVLLRAPGSAVLVILGCAFAGAFLLGRGRPDAVEEN